jgi:ATP-binding cassette subfamily B protein
MRLLFSYLSNYKKILFFALFLAFINQAFSLLDPQIFRLIIDNYATRIGHIPQGEFIRGVVLLLLASMGVALVSRTAKNFQDYYVNVATQRVGARMYQQSVSHSFSLPYSIFEDQRSGQLLQNLSKARDDAQKLITSSVNTVFLSLVGIIIVIGYAFTVNWLIGSAYFLVIPAVGTAMFYTGRKIKAFQKEIVAQTAELAGSTTETMRNVELVKSLGLESQEAKRLNDVNGRILELELKKVKFVRKISFLQGTIINAVRSLIMLLMLWLVFNQSISLGQFFTLLFYSFAIFSPLADLGPVSSQYQETRASMDILQKILILMFKAIL